MGFGWMADFTSPIPSWQVPFAPRLLCIQIRILAGVTTGKGVSALPPKQKWAGTRSLAQS